jgi:transposase
MDHETEAICTPVLGAAWAGLDVSKKTFDAGIYFPLGPDQAPRPLNEIPVASFERTRDGVEEFARWKTEQLTLFSSETGLSESPALRVVMEATGKYSTELVAWIAAADPLARPVAVNPKGPSDFAKSLRVRNINDRAAARYLARFGYDNKPEPSEPMTPEFAELRELSRERDALIIQRVAAENRQGESTVSKLVAKIQKQLIDSLHRLEEKIETAIKKLISHHANLAEMMCRLQTIPGVGWVTAMVTLAELGDLCRFDRSRQLSAFVGLSPRTHDSGTSVHKRPRMCKQGSGRMRQALFLSALSVARTDCDLHGFYESLLKRGKPRMVALGAVMRKQLSLMRAMLWGKTDYQPGYASERNRNSHPQTACA